jgi:L-seryl-tRNA(Ser) seleniumtransferase
LPTLRLLKRTPAEIQVIAERARDLLAERLGADFKLQIVDSTSEIGSGALPVEELSTRAIRITHRTLSPDGIATIFRQAQPPVIGRIHEGAFMLDLRTVEHAAALAVRFSSAIAP